jgi:hypothetical protein
VEKFLAESIDIEMFESYWVNAQRGQIADLQPTAAPFWGQKENS